MKCFSVSGMLTAAASFAAALNGAVGAPITTPRSGAELSRVDNTPLPPDLAVLLHRNYATCLETFAANPRIFDWHTERSKQSLCFGHAGLASAFQYALGGAPDEINETRAGLHALAASRSSNPLPLDNAGHTGSELLRMNYRDYRDSRTSSYAPNRDALVSLMRERIAPEQRVSMKKARQALAECRDTLRGPVRRMVRKEIAERSGLAIMRSMGDPMSMDLDQLDDLRDDLGERQFGDSSIRRRMYRDALRVLVDEHQARSA